ncbi:MAG TPA: hypothetical protein VGJ28_10910 [Micromonosporaceae bacterium]
MASRMLARGLPRDPRASTYLVGFVVSTVVTILVVRGALAASGYPKIGGDGLHIAHVLWGGLLMALALVLAMSIIGQVVRPFVAILGGIGFGLFLDEVGKFVTSTNNYFFQPAVAIMYLTVVLFVLLIHWVHGRTPTRPQEYLAAALGEATAAAGGGISDQRRQRALSLVGLASDQPGADAAADLIRALPAQSKQLGDPLIAMRRAVQRLGRPIVGSRILRRITIGILVFVSVLQLAAAAFIGIADIFEPGTLKENIPNFASVGATLSACLAALCVVRGLWVYRRDKRSAYGWFQRSVLVDLLLTQVFVVASSQFSALPSIVVDLLMLGILGAARSQFSVPATAGFTALMQPSVAPR